MLLTSNDPLGHNTVLQYYDTAGNQVSGVSLADGTANYVSDLKSITTTGWAEFVQPDGTFTPATRIRLVPSGSGVKTAYPEP